MKIEMLLSKLGQEMGQEISLGEHNSCTLIFDQKYELNLEVAEDGKILHLYAELCHIPEQSRLRLYDILLEAHLFGYGTQGAYFGASQDLGSVILFKNFDINKTDYEEFRSGLENFLNVYEAWKTRIDKVDFSLPKEEEEIRP